MANVRVFNHDGVLLKELTVIPGVGDHLFPGGDGFASIGRDADSDWLGYTPINHHDIRITMMAEFPWRVRVFGWGSRDVGWLNSPDKDVFLNKPHIYRLIIWCLRKQHGGRVYHGDWRLRLEYWLRDKLEGCDVKR